MQTSNIEAWDEGDKIAKATAWKLIGIAIFAFFCATYFDPAWAVAFCVICGIASLGLAVGAFMLSNSTKPKHPIN